MLIGRKQEVHAHWGQSAASVNCTAGLLQLLYSSARVKLELQLVDIMVNHCCVVGCYNRGVQKIRVFIDSLTVIRISVQDG